MAEVDFNGSTYTVYDTLEAADVYLAASLFALKWQESGEDQKLQVMIMATRMMDALTWKGVKVDGAQLIEWPRTGTGVPPDDGVTPKAILNGFFELCALIADDPTVIQNANSGSNVQRAKGGEAEVWFFKSTLETATRLPPIVHNWVKAYLSGMGEGDLSMVTGADCEFTSIFDEPPIRTGGLY